VGGQPKKRKGDPDRQCREPQKEERIGIKKRPPVKGEGGKHWGNDRTMEMKKRRGSSGVVG